jgi:hypothetical protein
MNAKVCCNFRPTFFATGAIMLLSLAGCAMPTGAQRQVQQVGLSLREASAQAKTCVRAVQNKPEYALLLPHTLDPDVTQPTMAMLTDERLPTSEEAREWSARHDEISICRDHALQVLSSVRPDAAGIVVASRAASDALGVQLVERKITWAEFARRGQGISAETRRQLTEADREWMADRNAEHRDELARRERAANALMQWSLGQQMINATNRPVFTNCNGFANSVSCVTH